MRSNKTWNIVMKKPKSAKQIIKGDTMQETNIVIDRIIPYIYII